MFSVLFVKSEYPMAPAKSKAQILIVDDDVAVRSTMDEYITTAGYESDAVS